MSTKALDAKKVAEAAIRSIGLGYDLTNDLKLKFCKRNSSDPRLIAIDDDQVRIIDLPNGISIPNVPKSIKCDKGDRMRLCSDVLSFQQVYFNLRTCSLVLCFEVIESFMSSILAPMDFVVLLSSKFVSRLCREMI